MASQIPEEIHIRNCMLLEFHKSSNATVATKNICDVYPSALDVRKCQRMSYNVYSLLVLPPIIIVVILLAKYSKLICSTDCDVYCATLSPSAWGERYPTCFGKQQSPVAINTRDVMIDLFAQKLQMKNYDIPVAKSTIINNGHSAISEQEYQQLSLTSTTCLQI
ncbi:UNVERIFIED_CONTAM: Ca6 [Trichonephila clavipes]